MKSHKEVWLVCAYKTTVFMMMCKLCQGPIPNRYRLNVLARFAGGLDKNSCGCQVASFWGVTVTKQRNMVKQM